MPKVKKLSKSETLNRLLSFSSVAVLIHRSPDGDALGSGAALCLFLRRAGVDATLLSPDPIPPRLAFLCEGVPLCKEESPAYIVTVDVASLSQCGRLAPAVLAASEVLSIDHHALSVPFAPHYTVGKASAAAEVLFDLFKSAKRPIDKAIATRLYAAVSSDTGCFRFANVTPKTHAIAASLLKTGVDGATINHLLFETKEEGVLRAEAYTATNARQFFEGRFSLLSLSLADCRAIGCTEEDFNGAIDILRSRRGVEIAALLRERGDGTLRLSLRSTGADVAALCALFGGGGHRRAAGCTMPFSDLVSAEEALLLRAEEAFFKA